MLDLMVGDVSEYLPTKEKLLEQHMGFITCGSSIHEQRLQFLATSAIRPRGEFLFTFQSGTCAEP